MLDWNEFLHEWESEIIPLYLHEFGIPPESLNGIEVKANDTGTVRFPGASDEDIQLLEQRIGKNLPPSYINFLKVSNGWIQLGMDAESGKLWPTEQVNWLKEQDPQMLSDWLETSLPFDDKELHHTDSNAYDQNQDPGSFD